MTKQVFAIRLLEAITGLEYKKRLQKMIGVPLPEKVAELMTGLPEVTVPPGLFSALPPALVSVWAGGPVHITQAIEGEIIVPVIYKAKINTALAEDSTIVAAVADRKIQLRSYVLTVAGETNLTWKSGATAISGAMDLGGTDEPRGISAFLGDFPLETTAGAALVLANSIAVQLSGYVTYTLE